MEGKDLKKLVIFYSLEGNTRFIAKGIKDIAGADLVELKPKKDVKAKGFMKYVWGGKQVVMGKKPELLPIEKNLDDYDVIFLGTPIWAGRYTPAINTLLHEYELKDKKLAFFCCSAGGDASKAFKLLREKLDKNNIVGEIGFKDPLKNGNEETMKGLEKWVNEIL